MQIDLRRRLLIQWASEHPTPRIRTPTVRPATWTPGKHSTVSNSILELLLRTRGALGDHVRGHARRCWLPAQERRSLRIVGVYLVLERRVVGLADEIVDDRPLRHIQHLNVELGLYEILNRKMDTRSTPESTCSQASSGNGVGMAYR